MAFTGENEHCAAATAAALRAERARLAGDLHDGVVQHIIATSMTLAAMTSMVPGELRPQFERLILRQDEIVRELRGTIFALTSDNLFTASATVELARVVDQSAAALGFQPTFRLRGPLDRIDPVTQLGHMVLALREVLSNIARHADATRALVTVTVSDDRVELAVDDNGRGLDAAATPGNGLANLDRRARMLGGECRIGPSPSGGTSVKWSIPPRSPRLTADRTPNEPTHPRQAGAPHEQTRTVDHSRRRGRATAHHGLPRR